MTFSVSDHIHFCICDGQTILFDTDLDRFFALPAPMNTAFVNFIGGAQNAEDTPSIDALVARRVLNNDLTERGVSPAPTLSRPVTSLLEAPQEASTWAAVAEATIDQALAGLDLKTVPIAKILRGIRREAARRQPAARSLTQRSMGSWARAFQLSQHIVPTGDQCLRRSIAMFRFLARRSCLPSFVIGVRAHNFGAHAWLQMDETVLNDTVEGVLPYTPIMVI
ncbi:lasso peptide biosynthesis B2 protein (plasmid) [Asticcacaulis sp. DW145]|uniref:lasso peptide biosynthesis B2 protein n=1 Tax=Asticcacaulis sp. DW145 TaxID=3095608 RepID=UPI00308C1918|nr:lasso peptide biosynthesis B2 protein [Asticcacaulis sp. DW145]